MAKVKFDENALRKLGGQAVARYAVEHRYECAYCHKLVQPPANLPAGSLPVCGECAESHGLV